MYEEWKPVFTALACDVMDKMGYREQAMDSGVRPAQEGQQVAGRALTLDAHATTEDDEDPYGQIFEAYDHMQPGDVVVIATNGEQSLPSAVNVPIECGCVSISPSDLILADVEGVVAIPQDIGAEVLRRSLEKLEGENTVRRELEAGDSPRVGFDRYGIL